MSLKAKARTAVNRSLRPLGFEVVRQGASDPAIQPFLPAKETLAAARDAGLPVGDYIDRQFAEIGASAATVEAMLRIGGLNGPVERVCEVGPGSGRYAEKVIDRLHPQVYEAYETANDWLPHLRTLPSVVTLPCDGHTLASTDAESVDLVHAHKVFVYIPFSATIGYLREMARVARRGGIVAFDVVTEDCLDEKTLDVWLAEGTFYLPMPRRTAVETLGRCGLSLIGNQFAPLPEGRTELLVFRKD